MDKESHVESTMKVNYVDEVVRCDEGVPSGSSPSEDQAIYHSKCLQLACVQYTRYSAQDLKICSHRDCLSISETQVEASAQNFTGLLSPVPG